MSGNRAGRRRRHRRHKWRTKITLWRLWPAWLRGREFQEMVAFVDIRGPAICCGGPAHGQEVHLERGQREVHFAEVDMTDLADYTRLGERPLGTCVRSYTYEVKARREGRMFYGGANRRTRRLTPVLEFVDDR